MKCQRCGADEFANGILTSVTRIKLVGGYHALLCRVCENEWSRYVRTTDEWGLMMAEEARKECYSMQSIAGNSPDIESIKENMHLMLEAELKLFDLGKKFCENTEAE